MLIERWCSACVSRMRCRRLWANRSRRGPRQSRALLLANRLRAALRHRNAVAHPDTMLEKAVRDNLQRRERDVDPLTLVAVSKSVSRTMSRASRRRGPRPRTCRTGTEKSPMLGTSKLAALPKLRRQCLPQMDSGTRRCLVAAGRPRTRQRYAAMYFGGRRPLTQIGQSRCLQVWRG